MCHKTKKVHLIGKLLTTQDKILSQTEIHYMQRKKDKNEKKLFDRNGAIHKTMERHF